MEMLQIINVMAVSLDGKIATSPLENDQQRLASGFGSKEDQEHVRQQIAACDGVITGADSMRASRAAWHQTGRDNRYPHWFVFSRRGLEPGLKFWQQVEIPRAVVSPEPLPEFPDTSVRNLNYFDRQPAVFLREELLALGLKRVLLFGGGPINRLFYEADLVDEVKITISPMVVGSSQAPNFLQPDLPMPKLLRLASSKTVGDHVFLTYKSVRK